MNKNQKRIAALIKYHRRHNPGTPLSILVPVKDYDKAIANSGKLERGFQTRVLIP